MRFKSPGRAARWGAGLVVLATTAGAPAWAGSATANLGVSATVGNSCLVSTTPVSFGTYNPASGTTTDTAGSVVVTCVTGTTYAVSLDAGTNASTAGNVSTRRMSAGASKYLAYQLYLDSSYSTVWGDGNNGSTGNPSSGTFTGTGLAISHTVYGRIPSGNFVASGVYADTVVATVTYN